MIHPLDMLETGLPVAAARGLHRATGLWGRAFGVLRPFVELDRMAEGLPGFEALVFHEGLHVQERHALVGIVLLAIPVVGWILWPFWRREQEIRADAFAFAACRVVASRDPIRGQKVAEREFSAFCLMHPHPRDWFWRWCYGRNPSHRYERAKKRAGSIRWRER